MHSLARASTRPGPRAAALAGALALASLTTPQASGQSQSWPGYGRDSGHTSVGAGPSAAPKRVRWSAPVDDALANQVGSEIFIHYGSPSITGLNTVIVPVRQANGSFRVDARRGSNGSLVWSQTSDYALPHDSTGKALYDWIPPFGPTLTPNDQLLVMPGAGGTVLARANPDLGGQTVTRYAFYGNNLIGSVGDAIQVSTPITSDRQGNLYFGYLSYYNGIASGVARVSNTGAGTYVSAAQASNDPAGTQVALACAPALSGDGTEVYVAVRGSSSTGYLCRLDSTTLAFKSRAVLNDPATGALAWISDESSASPTVGPDGDVYYGVLESNFPGHHARGWLLHFDRTLATLKTPGSFGWDDTASVVPGSAVPSYQGTSTYLVLTKYNDYSDPGIGGSGLNKVAVLDPNAAQPDPINGTTPVMQEVLTVVGVTPNTGQAGVREWCINSAAVDPVRQCAVVNSEDGSIYRWDFVTNTLTAKVALEPPTGEAYTPTVIGQDGAVYAINDAVLFCCDASTSVTVKGPGRVGITTGPQLLKAAPPARSRSAPRGRVTP